MRAREFLTELRDRMYQYIKSIVPGFPDYVVKDWLYANFARGATQGPNWSFDTIGKDIPNILKDMGLSVDTKWQLVPNMKFTMSMWEPKTLKRLQARAGGSSKSADPDVHIPARDAERHATQAQLAQQQGGIRKEPVILIKTPQGYELLEGWHRTIQHFARYPDVYVGPAYVAVAQSKPGITESMAAGQVLDYVKRTHAPDEFNIEYSITDHPEWELKNILLSQLNLDPDGETQDPYNRVNWVDDDKVQELIPRIGSVLKSKPIVIDSEGWIIDGNHRAMAAVEAGMTSVPALVPVKQGVAEDAENFNGIDISMEVDGDEIMVRATAGGRELGHVLFVEDGEYLMPQDLEVEERFQGQGIAAAMYDYVKSKGYKIRRSGQQTDAGAGFWRKNRGEENVWENFADGRVKGKSRPGRVKRAGASCAGSVTDLRAKARKYGGERGKMYHWCANMKGGKK